MLETHIERLVTDCGCTTEDFFQALKQADAGERQQCIEFILAAANYEEFIEMMGSYKDKLAAEGGAQ